MDKALFISSIQAIEEQSKKDVQFAENMEKCFPNAYSPNLLYDNNVIINQLIKILVQQMNDTENWIEHFIYELKFGKENDRLKVYIHEKEIPLSTAEDLYNLLKLRQ